ncbi:NDR1/HIN1-like protein 10 [Panicum virgatum]|uniref:Late embryogenesis abundant protein LEA-2 subgroup domain-containing protein n=1 Tax=Panicum virgatum TaxID=38727 RepID=A0A8T0S7K7_PANVG|nr:NDR1/HIN1-like protein 10 [Panicum virgatum]KAG2593145.1 hypothetical protein PVAP13_5NG109736 [Panicum virgatum]
MNHPQEGVVYGYTELTYVSTAGPPPYPPPPPPPPPPPRRRLSLFCILVRAFIGVCFFIGALALLIWLIYRPRTIQVAVATATLSGFDLNTTASITPVLSYNLTAALAVTNPNRRVSIYYDQLQAVGLYQGVRFGRATLPLSFQGTRRTDAAPALLAGRSLVDLNADAFGEDSRTGVFPVDLWVEGMVRYKFGELTTTTASTLKVKCHLALKLMVASGWVDCTVIDF